MPVPYSRGVTVSGAGDRLEQFAGLAAEPLYVSQVRLVAVCQHPGLELLGPQAAVAGHHGSGYRLNCNVQVLTRASAVRQGIPPCPRLPGSARFTVTVKQTPVNVPASGDRAWPVPLP
jgi:hypothetical protein